MLPMRICTRSRIGPMNPRNAYYAGAIVAIVLVAALSLATLYYLHRRAHHGPPVPIEVRRR